MTRVGILTFKSTMRPAENSGWTTVALLCTAQSKPRQTPACCSRKLGSQIIEELHQGIGGGHLGHEKMFGRLKERLFYLPGH